MNALNELDQKHPILTGLIGTIGGCFSWFMQHLEDMQRIVAFIGTIAGAGVAVLTLIIKIRAYFSRHHGTPPKFPDDDLP